MSEVLRAITIRQPWAHLIVHGGKTVENRSWNTRFRGRVLIHAGLSRSLQYMAEAELWVARHIGEAVARKVPAFAWRRLHFGGIIGAATVVDVLPPTASPTNPWHMPGYYGLVLADAEPVVFHPCKGMLAPWWGAFHVDPSGVVRAA